MKNISKKAWLMMEERVNTSINGLRNTRRKLFADENDSDGEEQNFYNRIIEESRQRSEEDMKKWNFDFKHEMPLPGRFKWVKTDQYGNEISDPTNLINEEQNRNEQEKQIEETDKNSRRRNDEPMNENPTKKAKLEKS
ncbi:cyclin-dependent kinase inhibitor 1-like [Formica exsecta]|uniref:cyclin-dependent kinase inhibitor 1-like n=2 Tax=Formica exsecta TaxID=72781 RepID=UPI0011421F95|nr:cyclin-dependent kinase inhibitor 1-like [Formica exsecta]